jgi:ATP-dependent exoDNAse (exonuclease V) alpha subunit
VRRWTDAYRDHGRLVVRPSAEEVRRSLVDDWWESARTRESDAVMIAHRRADVAELNALARARMHRDGRLADDELRIGEHPFATGDRVIARRNDRREGIVNGTRAEVVDVDHEQRSLRIEAAGGNITTISSSYLEHGGLDHGYALTAHAAQGATVDRSFVLGSDELYREWGYTALTRHRDSAKFYVVSPGTAERTLPGLEPESDAITDDVAAMFSRSGSKSMAIDMLEGGGRRSADRTRAIREAERRIAQLTADRADLGVWQRRGRKELDGLIERQREAIERWLLEKPAEAGELEPAAREAGPVAAQERLRATLVSPPKGIVSQVGRRPDGFREREQWSRAVARLIDDPLALVDPTDRGPTMHDTGLEL